MKCTAGMVFLGCNREDEFLSYGFMHRIASITIICNSLLFAPSCLVPETVAFIQGDSVARGPKLLSIKNYVIDIMT